MNPTDTRAVLHRLLVIARDCTGDLTDNQALTAVAHRAVADTGLTVLGQTAHAFVPHGLTIALVLAESHLVISTWPELRVATVDVVACASPAQASRIWAHLATYLRPTTVDLDTRVEILTAPGATRTSPTWPAQTRPSSARNPQPLESS